MMTTHKRILKLARQVKALQGEERELFDFAMSALGGEVKKRKYTRKVAAAEPGNGAEPAQKRKYVRKQQPVAEA